MSHKQSLIIFLRLFLPVAMLLFVGTFLLGQAEIEHELTRLKSQETLNVVLGAGALSRDLDGIYRDLHFLAGHSALHDAVDAPTPQHIKHLTEDLLNFSHGKGIYDQVRWIDEAGMEIVRIDQVNGRPVIVSADKLQNKGQRYFFTDTIKLKPGEIFVSPLDLNIEQDKIEVPHKPMIRVATPLVDSRGARRGIAILNYYGRVMLDSFSEVTKDIADHVMLVNRDGYWLKSPKADEEWGFMLKRPDLTLAARAPTAWPSIRSADAGQAMLTDGLWTWRSVHPLLPGQKSSAGAPDAFVPSRGEVEAREYVWKSVAHLSSDALSAFQQAIWLRLAGVAGILLGLLGVGGWKLASAWTALASSEAEVRRLNVGLEQKVGQRTSELSNKVAALDEEIAERKQAAKALQASEERFRRLFEGASDGIMTLTADGALVAVNDSFARMHGYSTDEMRNMNLKDFDTPETSRLVPDRMRRILAGESMTFEVEHYHRDGHVFPLEVSASLIRSETEVLIQCFHRDIAERKEAEAKIHRLTQFYAALSQSNEAILRCASEKELFSNLCRIAVELGGVKMAWVGIVEPDTRMLRFVSHFGDRAGEYLQDVEISVDADGPLRHAPTCTAIRENRPIWVQDCLLDPITAHWRERRAVFGFRSAATLPIHRNGVVVGVLTLYSGEVGAFDEAARELLLEMATNVSFAIGNFAREAARMQAEAARAKLEAQLRESQKMEALGTLAGGVAHDFNNALAAILGNTELIRQDVGPGHAALESLDEISKASRRAKNLVQQILAFGRRQTIERKVIALAPVVQEAVKFLRSTIPAGISLNVECAPEVPSVLADATQIEQVLINLGSNAWYAVDGQARAGLIEIRLQTELRNGQRFVVLTVRDNGRGMDDATRARIFEPFFTTKPVDKGTGLGLSVVYGIVQAHEGSIEVHSTPGEGASFVISFPAAQASATLVPSKNESPGGTDAGEVRALWSAGKRVLYVDDEESIVSLIKRLLERRGYRVSGYTDPLEALAAVRADPEKFDLAVTDYNMPQTSGLEFARTLREIRADLPVILTSGYITEELQQEAVAAGVRELIFKAEAVEVLCEAIARYTSAQIAKASSS